jgi:ankyrin repeat protein
LSKALDENDFVSFKKLYAMGLSITPDYARKLISFAITERKSSAFISYILHEFSLDPNMRLPGNTTFLMIAARENNKEAAQALLDAGADANLAIGGKKAIDIAFKEGSVAVEALLRAWKK